MTTTCLISNDDCARFTADAVDSALAQSVPFDAIVIIDDSSAAGMIERLATRYVRHPKVEIVARDHRGNLSCIHGSRGRSIGDIVFFLDGDDVYEPHYVETAIDLYDRDRNCDFMVCGHRAFGQRRTEPLQSARRDGVGYSAVLGACLRDWIGAPPSCLSMRRRILERIPRVPRDRLTWTDDRLVFGASLAAARRYYLAQPLARCRVHERHRYFDGTSGKFAAHRRQPSSKLLFEYLESMLCSDAERVGLNSGASLVRWLKWLVEMTGQRSAKNPAQTTRRVASLRGEDCSPTLFGATLAADTSDTGATDSLPRRRRAA